MVDFALEQVDVDAVARRSTRRRRRRGCRGRADQALRDHEAIRSGRCGAPAPEAIRSDLEGGFVVLAAGVWCERHGRLTTDPNVENRLRRHPRPRRLTPPAPPGASTDRSPGRSRPPPAPHPSPPAAVGRGRPRTARPGPTRSLPPGSRPRPRLRIEAPRSPPPRPRFGAPALPAWPRGARGDQAAVDATNPARHDPRHDAAPPRTRGCHGCAAARPLSARVGPLAPLPHPGRVRSRKYRRVSPHAPLPNSNQPPVLVVDRPQIPPRSPP